MMMMMMLMMMMMMIVQSTPIMADTLGTAVLH